MKTVILMVLSILLLSCGGEEPSPQQRVMEETIAGNWSFVSASVSGTFTISGSLNEGQIAEVTSGEFKMNGGTQYEVKMPSEVMDTYIELRQDKDTFLSLNNYSISQDFNEITCTSIAWGLKQGTLPITRDKVEIVIIKRVNE